MNGQHPKVAKLIDRLLDSDDFKRLVRDLVDSESEDAHQLVGAVIGEIRAGIRERRERPDDCG